MARREYLSNWPCGEPGCRERGLYAYDTKRELQEAAKRYAQTPWRCTRHTRADEVLSVQRPRREVALIASKVPYRNLRGEDTFLDGLFWLEEGQSKAGSGFTHGPGFKAWASDFPEGTRLVVTSEVTLPNE